MNIKTLQYTNLLKLIIQNFTPTSGSLQLCYEIVNNILIVPEFIQSRFKCVSGVSRNNPVRQTISYIDYSVSATRFGFECVRFYADHTVNAVPRYIQPTAVYYNWLQFYIFPCCFIHDIQASQSPLLRYMGS